MDLFAAADGRKRRPGYLPLFDDATLADERVLEEAVTPEERDSVLRSVGELTGGTLSRVGDALALPDDLFRGAISGRPGERVTGRDLLRGAGLIGEDDNWGNFVAGLGTEILTSPTGFLTGPAKALTPLGRAAKKAGLLDTAATAATRKAISSGLDNVDLPLSAQRTRKALEDTGRNITTFDPATVGRPLFGPRVAQRTSSLDDLIKYADDPDAAKRALEGVLGTDELARMRGEVGLSKSVGFGLPFQDPFIVGDAFGKGFGDKYADALDTLGQAYRWGPVGRTTSALFDRKVDGALDAETQLTNIANFGARDRMGGIATNAHVYQLAKLRAAHPEVFSEDGNRALGRYIEGDAARTAADVAYVESRPALKEYADNWIANRGDYLEESKRYGLTANELTDKYGIDYLPRKAEALLEMEGKRDRKLGSALSAMTGDMMGRTDAMQVPGGRDTIIDLSRDAMISGSKRTLTTDDEAAGYILNKLSALPEPPPGLGNGGNAVVRAGQPAISFEQAKRLARVLNSLPDEIVKQSPLFGQHPTEMIGSYMRGRNEAMATADTLYDSLASFAKKGEYGSIEGGKHISMQEALNRLGLKTYDDAGFDVLDEAGGSIRPVRGATQQMRDRIARIYGGDPDAIRMADISIPEEHVNRLMRARDAFTTGEASQSLVNYLDHYTQAWRGSILTWPARAVRDMYSGAVSNWLEGAFTLDGVAAARALMQEGPESPRFLRTLKAIPRYSADDGVAQFYADLAQSGLISGNQFYEAGAATLGKNALSALPGTTPVTTGTIIGELLPQQDRAWSQYGKDFFSWRSKLKPLEDTRNPILRAGEQMNSLSDGINRLSGYLSLLKQGYDPQAAARAMKRAHVDYAGLSSFEKTWMKSIFPWYSFQSRIFREVLRQLIEQPGGRYGQLIKATEAVQDESDGTYIPSDLRSQFAFPIPEEFGGVPAPGTQTYLKDLDFPGFDQINMVETPGTAAGTATGTMRQILMQTHPFIRQGMELGIGQDLYTKQPIGEGTSALDAALRAYTGNQQSNVPAIIDKSVENLPFLARPLGVVRSMVDTRGDQPLSHRAIKTGINAVSGIKVQDVDQQRVLGDAIREIDKSIDPYTREFKQTYIPEQLQPMVPQWALRRQAVARALEREKREARKPKKKAAPKKTKKQGSGIQLFD